MVIIHLFEPTLERRGQEMSGSLNDQEKASLERLVRVAQSDTGQSRISANFLLAWWNAKECGGFDLTDLWGVDASIREDMLTVLILLIRQRRYPDALGYGKQFESVVRAWRSSLVSKEG
jgi:hypothetical protein